MEKEIELLGQLTPAETYLIREHPRERVKNLLKYSLSDLFLKKILQSEKVMKQSNSRDKPWMANFIYAGKDFETYKPLPNEQYFLDPFKTNPSKKLLIRQLIKIAVDNIGGRNAYIQKAFFHNPQLEGCFRANFWDLLFKRVSLTEEGFALQKRVKAIIFDLNYLLPELIKSDPKRAIGIISSIKGNIFFLNHVNIEILKEIDQELILETNNKFLVVYISTYFGIWQEIEAVDNILDVFDDGFHSFDSSDSTDIYHDETSDNSDGADW